MKTTSFFVCKKRLELAILKHFNKKIRQKYLNFAKLVYVEVGDNDFDAKPVIFIDCHWFPIGFPLVLYWKSIKITNFAPIWSSPTSKIPGVMKNNIFA